MGLGGISVWQLLVILLIVVVIFGPKRIKGIGSDLGHALKSFRSAVNDPEEDADKDKAAIIEDKDKQTADAKFREEVKDKSDKD